LPSVSESSHGAAEVSPDGRPPLAIGVEDVSVTYRTSLEKKPTFSARLQIKPWTTYTTQQLFSCKGP